MNYQSALNRINTESLVFSKGVPHTIDTQLDEITHLKVENRRSPMDHGWIACVQLRTRVPGLFITIERRAGKSKDPVFSEVKAQCLLALEADPFRVITKDRIQRATDMDGLLFDPSTEMEEAQDALRRRCADHSQKRLDGFAASLGYDNITTLRAASFSTVQHFRAEGVAGQAAWDAEWSAAQSFMASVLASAVDPTFENYTATMPASYAEPAY